jgi:hypothetical protein
MCILNRNRDDVNGSDENSVCRVVPRMINHLKLFDLKEALKAAYSHTCILLCILRWRKS